MIYILLVFLLAACSQDTNRTVTTLQGNAMTIDYKITVGHPVDSSELELIKRITYSTFEEVNQVYNRWNPQSEISRLNRMQTTDFVPISEDLYKLLKEVDKYYTLSEGLFDPTVEPLVVLWKEKLNKNQIPSSQEIEKTRQAVGWNHIKLVKGNFSKDNADTQIDLGGIAKGYAVDLIVERLNKLGYKNILVEWGGEIRASGKHPEGRPWKVAIPHPNDPTQTVTNLILEDEAIATSGDYNQYWTYRDGLNKITFTHVINPKTGYPLIVKLNSIASVSVLAPTCTTADALATAAMVFPDVASAQAWIARIDNQTQTEFWFVTRDRDVK